MHDKRGKVRVLFIGQTPPPYGGQSVANAAIAGAEYTRVEISLLRMNFSRSLSEVSRFQLRKILHFISLLFHAIRLTLWQKPDVICYPPTDGVHRFPFWRDVWFLFILRSLFPKRKFAFIFHSAGVSDALQRRQELLKGWRGFLVRRALFQPASTAATSEFNPPDGAFLQTRISLVIHCGIPDEHHGKKTLSQPEHRSGPVRFLYLGVIRPDKGIDILLEACSLLRQRGMNFQLTCAGEFVSREYRQTVEAALDRTGLSDRVHFPGVVRGGDKTRLFQEADLFCYPTFAPFESFGMVVAEAMMHQRPVVASRWRGVQSLVMHDDTGLLVEEQNTAALADGLQRLIEAPSLREEMGQRGRQRFLEAFTETVMVNRYEDWFHDIGTAG
jgi:glycosyltransferase involved in cell wall biosynthesis